MKDLYYIMLRCDRHISGGGLCSPVLVVCVVVALAVGPSVVAGSDGTGSAVNSTDVTGCGTIDEPGQYVVTGDIEGDKDSPCIEIIGTDSVVLDGNGFAISNARVGVDVRDSSNVDIKNLYLNEIELNGIGVWDSEDIEIHGNNVSNTGYGQGFENNSIHIWQSNDIEIYNNNVSHTLGRSDGIYAGRTNSVHVHGNRVENASYRGLAVLESKNIFINRNTVRNPATDGWGIEVFDDVNATVVNNSISNTWYGIEAKYNGTDLVFRNNRITNTTRCAIAAEPSGNGSVSDVVIEDNFMQNHSGVEVMINSSDVTVRDNTIKSSLSQGIRVNGIAGNVTIHRNEIMNSSSAAILVADIDAELQIMENDIHDNPSAIRVRDTHRRLQIVGNDIRHHWTGIRFLDSSGIRVERNRFTDINQVFVEENSTGIEYHNNAVGGTDGPSDSSGQSGPGSETDGPSDPSGQSDTAVATDEPSDPSGQSTTADKTDAPTDSSGGTGPGFGPATAIVALSAGLLIRWLG